jgi:ribonucleotide reductase alpha subunit
MLRIPFHSDAAVALNKAIFETMYHAAVSESVALAIEHRAACRDLDVVPDLYDPNHIGSMPHVYEHYKPIRAEQGKGAYSSFEGSPMSRGEFQFDLWGVTPSMYDWDALRTEVKLHGMRNSLLLAPMPTASTAQILGNNECFEPITSNIYSRRTLAGEFAMVNTYLVKDLIELGMWDLDMKTAILAHHGSIQKLAVPQELKDLYKTVWEIPMKHLIQMSRDRGAFICQSQSLNLWVEEPTYPILTSMHFYSWEQGLKTGMYYLRRKPRYQAQQFTVEPCETCSA